MLMTRPASASSSPSSIAACRLARSSSSRSSPSITCNVTSAPSGKGWARRARGVHCGLGRSASLLDSSSFNARCRPGGGQCRTEEPVGATTRASRTSRGAGRALGDARLVGARRRKRKHHAPERQYDVCAESLCGDDVQRVEHAPGNDAPRGAARNRGGVVTRRQRDDLRAARQLCYCELGVAATITDVSTATSTSESRYVVGALIAELAVVSSVGPDRSGKDVEPASEFQPWIGRNPFVTQRLRLAVELPAQLLRQPHLLRPRQHPDCVENIADRVHHRRG